jgi:N-hydroxyarylamine O-acetyltransferase
MLLAVDVLGTPWLADVGFGGDGLPLPIPFEPGPAVEQMGRTYRLVVEPAPTGGAIDSPSSHVLQTLRAGGWFDLYAFTLEQRYHADYEMANWFTSTHPRSPFVQGVVAQRLLHDGWLTLHGLELTRSYTDGRSETTMVGEDELLSVLAERFGLEFPLGTRFA